MTSFSPRRVVVTGLGLVSPLGDSPTELLEALMAGRSGVAELTSMPTQSLPTSFGAECTAFSGKIEDFGPLDKDQTRAIRKNLKVMCREIQMGVAAAQKALFDARLKPGGYDPERTGVVFGADYILSTPDEFRAGVANCLDARAEFQISQWAEKGIPEVTPLWLLKYLPNMPASHVAIYNDLRGPNNSITLREASANLAVAEAYCTILRGSADTTVVGATGTRIHPMRTIHVALQEQLATNGTPTAACRPFDLNRSGMVIGEGAGAIVLEELGAAQARGATILGEIVGHASSTAVTRNGVGRGDVAVANVLHQALRSSGLSPDAVGHIHAHGLSTRKSDAEEAQGIRAVFGHRAVPVPVTAAKSYFGNLGAASGLVELIASLLALRSGRLFPVLNFETPDPECPINVAGPESRDPGDNFITLNITPQGQAAAIVVRRYS